MVKKILNIISTIVLVVLIIIVIYVFYVRATGNVPEIFGFQVYRVQSGSMSPTLEIGDVILSRKVEPSDIHKGDIITYKGEEGELRGKLITHEVILEPQRSENGEWKIQTQGVASGALPDPPISSSAVLGKYVVTLSFLNGLYSFFLSPTGLIVFIFIIVALFGYEMISLLVSYKKLDENDEKVFSSTDEKPSKKRKQ